MTIKYAISPYPALHENMVARVYEASSPNAQVASFTIVERDGSGTPTVGAGHQVPVTIEFNGLDRVVHVVRLFTASSNLLHEYDEEPKEDIVTVFDPIFFRVGDGGADTPAAGQPIFLHDGFIGLTAADISVNQEGLGFLIPGTDYLLEGNGLTLQLTEFEDGQRWYIFKKPKVVTTVVNDSVVGKGWGGFIDVVSNIDYIPSHLRKLIRMSGAGNYTFPAMTAVPIGYIHAFTNFGTNPSSPKVFFLNGSLLYGGAPKSELIIPFGATCHFTWDGTNWSAVVMQNSELVDLGIKIVGQGSVIMGDILSGDILTTIVHGLNLPYEYKVFGTLKGTNATWRSDNNCWWSAFDYTNNAFSISIQEVVNSMQNLTFEYILVKS